MCEQSWRVLGVTPPLSQPRTSSTSARMHATSGALLLLLILLAGLMVGMLVGELKADRWLPAELQHANCRMMRCRSLAQMIVPLTCRVFSTPARITAQRSHTRLFNSRPHACRLVQAGALPLAGRRDRPQHLPRRCAALSTGSRGQRRQCSPVRAAARCRPLQLALPALSGVV